MIADFSIVPLGTGESLSGIVAEMVRTVRESGIAWQLTPMGTVVEGEWDEVMGVIKACHAMARTHAGRVVTSIRIDDREGRTGAIEGKVRSVEAKL